MLIKEKRIKHEYKGDETKDMYILRVNDAGSFLQTPSYFNVFDTWKTDNLYQGLHD